MSTRQLPVAALGATCPCGCGVVGPLTKRHPQHARGCQCNADRGRRNRSAGQRAQRHVHKALGGEGRTPTNEEWGRGYPTVLWLESKSGYDDDTKRFYQFLGNAFFRSALGQAERSLPTGLAAKPGVAVDGKWAIVRLR